MANDHWHMNDWFKEIGAGCELPEHNLRELLDSGFVVIPGPLASDQFTQSTRAYDLAVAGAVPPDLSISSENTRVHDFVNRGAANLSAERRRSIQGAYIPRQAEPWANWATRILPQTRPRIGSLAQYLLAV